MTSLLARVLWPARCVACAAPGDEGDGFCAACAAAVVPLEDACPGCALPTLGAAAAGRGGDARCRACRFRPFPFALARAVLIYGGAAADAIVRFKHGSGLAPARPLGRCLVPLLDWACAQGVDVLMPVPLHPRRLRQRGFNQTLELLREARAIARARAAGRGLSPLPLLPDRLVRTRDTPALGHLPPLGRRHQVAGAFAVKGGRALAGASVLVVDDVMTTGATLAECAQTLLEAGAARVLVGALARAL